jgi:menaquinone-dependent protoporphyrinogen oxidase
MRVLIVYASKYGSTKGIAERIGQTLREKDLDVELRSADADSGHLADENYDAYVIGSAIHASHWLRAADEFVRADLDVLAKRPVWLFSSGPIGAKYVRQPQPDPAEIAEFRRLLNARDHVVFAGAFDPATVDQARAGWLERQISKRFLPVGDFRDWAEIEAWANGIARALSAVPVA